MANGIRTGDPRGFNKGRSSKFREGSQVRQTPEEGRKTYRPKRCGNNNKDEDNSPKTLNDKNQASFQKFRQLVAIVLRIIKFPPLRHYFVLLLKEIQFLFWSFPFLILSGSFCV